MPDFDDMFERISGDSERRVAERNERQAREREERDTQFERDRELLEAKAMPSLEDAKRNFEGRGVPVVISNNWSDIARPMHPEIAFHCEKDYQPNPIGGEYKPQGRTAFFSVRDGTFQVGLSEYPGQRVRTETLTGTDEEMIQKGIEEALSSYFRSIEEGERPF